MLDIEKIVKTFDSLPQLPMAAHPRLFIDSDAAARVKEVSNTPMLLESQRVVEEYANESLESVVVEYDLATHNSNLVRGRIMQRKVFSLLVRYLQTGDVKYRDCVIECIREMDRWPHWSWFDWRAEAVPDWEAEYVSYDLSFGENSMTVAVAYDLLYHTLSDAEKEIFFTLIKRHKVITEFIRHAKLGPGCARDGAGWIQNEKSNWLAVTCGGMGMLALAFYEDLEEARQALALVDPAMMTLMDYANQCGGSWPEGLGYFSYTLRYAIPYLTSWENATGMEHPAYALEGTKNMVEFFLNMQPQGVACTFGDNNSAWIPYGFHYILCRRLGQEHLIASIDMQVKKAMAAPGWDGSFRRNSWPIHAEWLLFAERNSTVFASAEKKQFVKIYPGTNFAVMADKIPSADFCMAIRGGNTRGAHEHNDLSSFHLVYGDEAFITSLSVDEYLDTTFSPRRHELFEMTPAAKNVLLVNGVGMSMFNEVKQEETVCCGYKGISMDCTGAMGDSGFAFKAVTSYTRTFLILSENAFLIVDNVLCPNAARFDLRFHSYANISEFENGVLMASPKHADKMMKMAFSASEKSVIIVGLDTPTRPKEASKVIRFASEELHKSYTAATLLTKDPDANVSLRRENNLIHIEAIVDEKIHYITL